MTEATELVCCDDSERRRLARKAPLNGLDYLEVEDDQRKLTVYFLGNAPENLVKENLRITGGQRIRDIRVLDVTVYPAEDSEHDGWMVVTVDRPGDFSTYALCVVALDEEGRPTDKPPTDFDPRYACLDFSFKAGCSSELDCKSQPVCPPPTRPQPDINYLAKDYASFRQLILDRLALIMPDWQERHVPDLGITLVEILAYVGDHLSYYQDAVATEAYLDTARQRISVRRHARLVDYVLHEGCNARAWVVFWVSEASLKLKADDIYFVTAAEGMTGALLKEEELPRVTPLPYLVFVPMVAPDAAEVTLYKDHNEIRIYTWQETQCCLQKGATSATLIDPGQAPGPKPGAGQSHGEPEAQQQTPEQQGPGGKPTGEPPAPQYRLRLEPCDVLIFEEVKGAKTGNPADADPAHRHAVRLMSVTRSIDPIPDPRSGRPTLIVEVKWGAEDALPFPLCISSVGLAPECKTIDDVSVARGNVLVVDHGRRLDDDLEQVPTCIVLPECCDECTPREVQKLPGPYNPRLPRPDLTFGEPLALCRLPPLGCGEETRMTAASTLLRQDPRKTLPHVVLHGIPAAPNGEPAFTANDLVNPEPLARRLAAAKETENESLPAAWLRGQLAQTTRDALDEWHAGNPLPAAVREPLLQLLLSLQQKWEPRQDLLASGPDDRHFTVEMDDERRAHLRFGDGDSGQRPDAGMAFRARYRAGNGTTGNVGAETITRMVFRTGYPSGVDIRPRNPLPAIGGTAPELVTEAKLLAPHVFRQKLERAVTPADYAAIVKRDFATKVQQAAAVLRWTGSGGEVLVAVDAFGGAQTDPVLLCQIERHLQRFRRIGHDLRVVSAHAVPLKVNLRILAIIT